MPDVRTISLGRTYQTNLGSPCLSYTGQSIHLATFGPVTTFVSATLSSGTLPPGMTPYVCPGASSALYVIGTPTASGVYTFQIDALMSNGSHTFWDCVHTVAVAGGCSLITVTPATIDDLLEGGDYSGAESIAFAASGGTAPYTWDVAGGTLPPGMAFSAGGVLSGTPTTPGDYPVTLRATATGGCPGVLAITLSVVEPDPIVVSPAPPLEEGRRGWLYVAIFTAAGGFGGPYAFDVSAGALPPGLSLSSLGVLAGLATDAGAFTFTVRATDDLGFTGTRAYTLEISGLRVLVAGEDRTIDLAAVDIELTLNRQATARLEFGDEAIPGRGVDVLIYARDGVTPIFGGLTLVRNVSGMAASNPANKIDVDCVDYSIYFDEADPITIVSTVSQDLEDVITSIVAQALAVYGITYTPTPTGKTVPPIEWIGITVPDAFKRITDATGVVFRVLPLKELDVFVPLDDDAPATITDAAINAFDLKWRDPPNLPRNTVDLLCGPTGNGIVTQQWTADGIATQFEVDIQAVIGDAFAGARSHAFLGPSPGGGGANVAAGATVELGASTYTFRASLVGDVAGEVLIGADVNASLANLVAAIVGAGGGVYAPSTPVNAQADAFMRYPDQMAVNALTIGVAGDAIAVSTSSAALLWYGEGTIPLDHLQLGADPSGAAGWTQGYILENGTLAQPLGGAYTWDVLDGRGTITAATAPEAGTLLELRYLAVFPFHAIYSTGTPRITFRENHPEIDNYAAGLALAQRIHARESADRRELEITTDVDGFLPGQALEIDTSYRGGIVADFLVATVRISLVNADLWEYSITAQQSDEYAGSFVEQWKALTSGSSSSSSTAPPATLTTAAGDIYSDGRNAYRDDQSMGGNRLTFLADPASDQDAATKAYTDAGDAAILAAVILEDGSVPFSGPQSMGGNALTNLDDPTNAQDAATKAYVDAGAGGGGGAITQIAQIITAGAQATVDFSSIPATYSALWIVWEAADTQAGTSGTTLSLKVNNDGTAGNYTPAFRYGSQNGAAFGSNQASTGAGAQVGFIPQAGNTNLVAVGQIMIASYARTTFHKRIAGRADGEDATNNGTEWSYHFRWKSTAAINRLTFTPGGTAFANGTVFTLYGVQ